MGRTERKLIKQSEARILIYLSVVHNTRKHVTAISNKLGMDYSYTMRVLQTMVFKKWLVKHPLQRHMFYELTAAAPLDDAKKEYDKSDALQTTLLRDHFGEENGQEKGQ